MAASVRTLERLEPGDFAFERGVMRVSEMDWNFRELLRMDHLDSEEPTRHS
jgi:hypothetical protein